MVQTHGQRGARTESSKIDPNTEVIKQTTKVALYISGEEINAVSISG